MANLPKILDRVRKLLALSENSPSEAEAASAASQAATLMADYELSEALVRLDAPATPVESIVNERLEPDKDEAHHKRVAWRESIAAAVAHDLGVRYYWTNNRKNGRIRSMINGMGRESAIQAWRYTYQYLCNAVDSLADDAWDIVEENLDMPSSKKAWKNAFRVGCSQRLAQRLSEQRQAKEATLEWRKSEVGGNEALALTVIEKDHAEVDREYGELSKDWKGSMSRVGQVSSRSGYHAGKEAGDRVSLGGGRAGLASGQGMITD